MVPTMSFMGFHTLVDGVENSIPFILIFSQEYGQWEWNQRDITWTFILKWVSIQRKPEVSDCLAG